MGLITRQPNRQFQDNMVSQLDDNMDRQKHRCSTVLSLIATIHSLFPLP